MTMGKGDDGRSEKSRRRRERDEEPGGAARGAVGLGRRSRYRGGGRRRGEVVLPRRPCSRRPGTTGARGRRGGPTSGP